MSFNGSGTFVINSSGQPVVTNTVISSTAFNALTADLGTGLSTTITKDGQTTTTAKIPFAFGLSAAAASNFPAGTVAAPGLYLSTDTGTGLYRIGANNDGFAVSGAKVLDIASTGLGVTGTLTSTGNAIFATAGTGGSAVQIGNATNNGSSLWFSGQSVAGGYKNWVIDQGDFANGVLSFAVSNSAGGVIGSSATEVLRLNPIDGYYIAKFINPNATPNGVELEFSGAAPNNTVAKFLYLGDSSSGRAYFYSNGGLANYSANNANLSDLREKKDIKLAGNYLDKICAIPVKTFLFNDQTDGDLNLGVIAQDVQAIAPELVMESDWGKQDEPKMRLSIYQTDLQYALMKSVQELAAKVAALEAK